MFVLYYFSCSGGGGEYVFPLIGHCFPPKPQGPYTIRAGQSIPIQFKNVFSSATTFVLSVDNPLFFRQTVGNDTSEEDDKYYGDI